MFAVYTLGRGDLPAARRILSRAYLFDNAAAVAEEKLFGDSPQGRTWTLGAWRSGVLVGVASGAGRYIRILAVHPLWQKQGAGTKLLEASCSLFYAGSYPRVAAEPGNYLSPGVDARDTETLAWLGRRGFRRIGTSVNLVASLEPRNFRRDSIPGVRKPSHEGYEVRRMRADDDLAPLRKVFLPAALFELKRADAYVALCEGDIVAFAAWDGNNRGLGWFGPMATHPEHEKRGLGAMLATLVFRDMAHTWRETEIAWLGPIPFYEKIFRTMRRREFAVCERTP